MIGYRVKWRYTDQNGDPADPLDGIVLAVERATSGNWWALVLEKYGTARSVDTQYLVVVELPNESFARVERASDPTPTEVAVTALELERDELLAGLDHLEKLLEENFKGTDHGGGPIEWASSLLLEFKKELIEVTKDRDSILKQLKDLKKAHKPHGPKGPGETA